MECEQGRVSCSLSTAGTCWGCVTGKFRSSAGTGKIFLVFQNEDFYPLEGRVHVCVCVKSNSQKIYRNDGEGLLRSKEFWLLQNFTVFFILLLSSFGIKVSHFWLCIQAAGAWSLAVSPRPATATGIQLITEGTQVDFSRVWSKWGKTCLWH